MMRAVEPDDPCDACGHASKFHARPTAGRITSRCMIVDGRVYYGTRIPKHAVQCHCTDFWPVPARRR